MGVGLCDCCGMLAVACAFGSCVGTFRSFTIFVARDHIGNGRENNDTQLCTVAMPCLPLMLCGHRQKLQRYREQRFAGNLVSSVEIAATKRLYFRHIAGLGTIGAGKERNAREGEPGGATRGRGRAKRLVVRDVQ